VCIGGTCLWRVSRDWTVPVVATLPRAARLFTPALAPWGRCGDWSCIQGCYRCRNGGRRSGGSSCREGTDRPSDALAVFTADGFGLHIGEVVGELWADSLVLLSLEGRCYVTTGLVVVFPGFALEEPVAGYQAGHSSSKVMAGPVDGCDHAVLKEPTAS
jgi:hypothetical protein